MPKRLLGCIAAGSALLALGFLIVGARADEMGVDVPCMSLDDLQAHKLFRDLSHDEWVAARSFFYSAPNTPADLPPGDRGLIAAEHDGSAWVAFVDGDDACGLMHFSKGAADVLAKIKAGVVTHPAGRM